MLKSPHFEVTITGMHSIRLPDHIAGPFVELGQKRVLVIASYEDRSVKFHAALQKSQGSYLLMFSKKNQKSLGVYQNDYFLLQLQEDQTKYGVEMPDELAAVLESDPEATRIFNEFPDGKKRSIIYMILRYATSETRIDKSILLCDKLKSGVRKTNLLLKSG